MLMKDNLDIFFSENNFDIHEPNTNHDVRFLQKLQPQKKKTNVSWKWMGIAASLLLLIGFSFGSYHQKKQYDLGSVSPKMKEAQDFFVSTINQELNDVEKYRNVNNEKIINDALDKIKELEENFELFKAELKTQENEHDIIKRMITNYQQRLNILNDLMLQLELLNKIIKTPHRNDEIS